MPLASAVRMRSTCRDQNIFEFICDASHKRTVDAVIEKPVDLYNVSGQNLALLDDAILQLLHSFLQKHNKNRQRG